MLRGNSRLSPGEEVVPTEWCGLLQCGLDGACERNVDVALNPDNMIEGRYKIMASPTNISADHDVYAGSYRRFVNWGIFKNKFERPPHTKDQANMSMEFMHCLAKCVVDAVTVVNLTIKSPRVLQFEEDTGIDRVQSFKDRVKEVKRILKKTSITDDEKNYLLTWPAAYGSEVELEAYHYLDGKWRRRTNEAGDYLLEEPVRGRFIEGVTTGLFPHSFWKRGDKAGSRPDVRLALGSGYEALFDITSEKQEGHILDKGANLVSGGWLARDNIPFIAEVYHSGPPIG